MTDFAVCPAGHQHPIEKDAAGFDTYGRAEGTMNWTCVWRRFRIVSVRPTA